MLSKLIPGTSIECAEENDAASVFRPLLSITGGLSLSQICVIADLLPSTIQNWVKRGFVPHPENKKYTERHLYRILLISALRDGMNIEDIGELMVLINGDTDDTSDDIISEEKLYELFCQAVRSLHRQSFNEKDINEVLQEVLNDQPDETGRLSLALKVMIYGYISGICQKNVNDNLSLLKK
ncbi:MAG: DUF1836 domain-containing protein [Erysipelotrichaceae bacterium]|nr:DUF1836 domain-containing protein [Erysipelotrichaceae bacterium]